MLIREYFKTREDNVKLYRTYSDMNKYIKNIINNNIYTEAIDIEDSNNEYIELDEKYNINDNNEII